MPVWIVTSLLLWSALLLPGASAGPKQASEGNPALCRQGSATPSLDVTATIRAWPLGQDGGWTISEADTQEEEETDDGDGDHIVSEIRWSSLRPVGLRLASAIRPDQGIVRSAARSPILRC
jgi:hypothetical protein